MSFAGKTFLYLIYFVIVGVLAGFIISESKSNPPQPIALPTQSQPPKSPPVPSPPTHTSTAPKQTSTTNQSTPLVNTGPGSVISLFIVVSTISAVAYRQLIIKRLQTDQDFN